jgi:hypothetical protein
LQLSKLSMMRKTAISKAGFSTSYLFQPAEGRQRAM